MPRGALPGLEVDVGIGDRSPYGGIRIAIDVGPHDRKHDRNEGRHDPAAVVHLSPAPSFRKGRTAVEHQVPEYVEPVERDPQYPVNVPPQLAFSAGTFPPAVFPLAAFLLAVLGRIWMPPPALLRTSKPPDFVTRVLRLGQP